jgi:predicted ATP-grasp superfamily ATP-dependent carboligase
VKRLAVAGLSARALAEQAAREGFDVVALDLFGDRDTLSAASRWLPIGDAAASLRIDGPRLLDALDTSVAEDGVEGWVAGGGFDGRADLLEQAAAHLPLFGNDAATVRRVRDPRDFFATLAVHGVVHPEVRHEGPVPAQDWLLKDAGDSGGRHVRGADNGLSAALPGALHYLQRAQAGTPMSATFIANGSAVVVLGCNEQLVGPVGGAPHAFRGVVGPLRCAPPLQRQVEEALHTLVSAFGLRGLCSLDFICDVNGCIHVLEVNPRPPASLALYAELQGGLLRAHLAACLEAALPTGALPTSPLRGTEIVHARRALNLSAAAADWLAIQADTHDLPRGAMTLSPGDPLCSVEAAGEDAATIKQRLAQRCDALLSTLEDGA